ncbi:phytoene/squalene synthase family protein [Thalassobaculum sp. OXR-137]|uniref:phytoene/squalene synthase family protein n=1 Tax=Thalassobaculum sp. OXR-137 TaxID=3100173 RepID=UPI002AC99C03|nr:phytoene/squalene synthase family protein [Thalassobaculum sp. OXR-137]WPZ36801.1 phytoene/squalene synthase family protein [Thalassobaculum sp. OXR-137]
MPKRSAEAALEAADRLACRAMIAQGSRSFHAASRLLPASVAEPALALYAFCRTADDAVDEAGADRVDAAVETVRDRLDGIYAGRPADDPVDREFARVVARFALPRALPDALVEGFSWDARGREYETIDELRAYAARVAGSVGAMMTVLMEARSAPVIARAADLGVAMQLTNIARDIGADARLGRLYLPKLWMREAGIDPDAWLARPRHDPALAEVVHRLLMEAERLYVRSHAGIGQLPVACRTGVRAAQLLYAEIGREVARRGYNGVDRRAVVGRRRKLTLLAWAMLTGQRVTPGLRFEPLPETRFLVEAVAASPAPRPQPGRTFGERAVWTTDLVMRLEKGDRRPRSVSAGTPLGQA